MCYIEYISQDLYVLTSPHPHPLQEKAACKIGCRPLFPLFFCGGLVDIWIVSLYYCTVGLIQLLKARKSNVLKSAPVCARFITEVICHAAYTGIGRNIRELISYDGNRGESGAAAGSGDAAAAARADQQASGPFYKPQGQMKEIYCACGDCSDCRCCRVEDADQ